MVFIGADPLLSPDHSFDLKQPFAAEFHCFRYCSGTSTMNLYTNPGRALFRPAPHLFQSKLASFFILQQPPFHCRRRTRPNMFTLLLLIIDGVEVNPGPTSMFRLGVLNTRSIVNKAPLLHSLLDDNEISILALTESWIRSDDPPVIKNGPAPPGYRILHVHRDSGRPAGSDQTRGGGLALVYKDNFQISPHKHHTIQTSFELQLVNICSPGRDFVLANIYRPPSASKSTFLAEFANLLTPLGMDAVDRLIICGDFN